VFDYLTHTLLMRVFSAIRDTPRFSWQHL